MRRVSTELPIDEKVIGPAAAKPQQSKAKAKANGKAAPTQPRLPTDLVLTIDQWLARDLPPPDFLLGDLLSTTSRALFVAPTGTGKTMMMMAMGFGVAAGNGFLHWRGVRPARVLIIDGEMSRRLMRQRIADEAQRFGGRPEGFHALSHEDIENFAPLNTPEGQRAIDRVIAEHMGGKVDLIEFDNVMSLLSGDMKDEEPWRQTLPWIHGLTKRSIGQVWIHHTGHDQSRIYGTSTIVWQMDLHGHLEPLARPDTDVSFTLTFPKARERTPTNRADFAECRIALVDDEWVSQATDGVRKGKVSPLGQKFLDALRNATIDSGAPQQHGCPTASLDQWRAECRRAGLIDASKGDSERSLFSKYKRELIVANRLACNEDTAWTLDGPELPLAMRI